MYLPMPWLKINRLFAAAVCFAVFSVLFSSRTMAAPPTVRSAMQLKPTQQVQYDAPAEATWPDCRMVPIVAEDEKGWAVVDATGRRLRCFIDSNADKAVDRWCYYLGGIEVYRDIDSDFNRKVDSHRWLGTAGSRWGIDKNEDGQIDRWKMLSAEEATAELVAALAAKDKQAFARLLLSKKELKDLALGQTTTEKIAVGLGKADNQFIEVCKQQGAPAKNTRWLHFSASRPGIIPSGTNGSEKDLLVYENVVAMTESDGKQGFLQVGTLIRAGDCWRLIAPPTIREDAAAASTLSGLFFTAEETPSPQVTRPTPGEGISPKLQKLLAALEKVEARLASAKPTASGPLYKQQAKLLEQLAAASSTPEQQAAWNRQLADNLSAATQSGALPDGTGRLEKLHARLKKQAVSKDVLAYVRYRLLMAAYSASMQKPKADYAKIQSDWLRNLKTFIETYPTSNDAAEALLQIAIAEEFAGNDEEAKVWYKKIAAASPKSTQARKANGAIRRLDSPGKPLSLKGRTIKGKLLDLKQLAGRVVLVHYWASWCEPCKADMAIIRDLVAKYGQSGFYAVGVNVDNDQQIAVDSIKKARLTWPQIYESGGLESRPATELGILTLPTMLLLDKKGRVISRNIHISEVEVEIKKRAKIAKR